MAIPADRCREFEVEAARRGLAADRVPGADIRPVAFGYAAEPGERFIYIGRPRPDAGLAGSPLANPFRLADRADDRQRAEVIRQFREWFDRTTGDPNTPQAAELFRIYAAALAGPVRLATVPRCPVMAT